MKIMKIVKLVDWNGFSYCLNMEFRSSVDGRYTVTEIVETPPKFKNERTSYDVLFSNNTYHRFFDVKEINYQ